MIVVWGKVEVRSECRAEAIRLSLAHVHRSRLEPGCIRHGVHVDVENENFLVFYEEWLDMAALHAHFQIPEATEFVTALKETLVGEPEMKIYETKSE